MGRWRLSGAWEAVERALPERGRGTLRLLERSLVSVRKEEKGTCFKLVYFTDNVDIFILCVAVPNNTIDVHEQSKNHIPLIKQA